MLKRCYSPRELVRLPTYISVQVSVRWRRFSNFIKDLPHLPNYQLWLNSPGKYALDKEFYRPCKIYHPKLSGFNTIEDNTRERNQRCGNPAYNKSRKVEGTSFKDGSKIYFNSTREAESLGGFKHGSISRCCSGKLKSYKGYYWRYV